MSDSLFGGATTTVAEVGKQLADLAKKFDELTEKVGSGRNPNLTADAVVMSGSCPAPLVGCNASELYKATGGQLTCPPLDQAPDPIITDHKGRICYAPESLREAWKGKNLNIRDLTEKYALKLVKMLENTNNLAVAVQAAQDGPKGSPIIINYYANNIFVSRYATGGATGVGNVAPAQPAPPAVQRNLPTLANFNPPKDAAQNSLVSKDELAAMLSKFSNGLDVNSGAVLVAELLNYINASAPTGVFDVDNRDNASKPQTDSVGAATRDGIVFPTHAYILQTLFTAVIATHRDSTRRARLTEAVNGLAVALEFGELAKTFDSTSNRRNQAITASASAISFLPRLFRDWISAGKVDGTPEADPRFTFAMFVNISLLLSLLETYDTSAGIKYVNCIKALRVAYNNMRSAESVVQELLKKKASGSPVFEEEIQQAMRNKRGASQGYVVQTVKLGQVLAELLTVDIKTTPLPALGAFQANIFNVKHVAEARTILQNMATGIAAQDALLAAALERLRGSAPGRQGLGLLLDFRGNGPSFSGNAARRFFQKIQDYSKVSAAQLMPEEEVFVTKDMFSNTQNAATFATNVNEQVKNKFKNTLPGRDNNFCKVKTSDKFVYLYARPVPNNYNANASNTLKSAGSEALKNGLKDDFQTALALFLAADGGTAQSFDNKVAYIVSKSCEPLESGDDALARKAHILGSGPIDQLIRKAYTARGAALGTAADLARMESTGMNKNERDMYTTLQIILHWASGDLKSANLAATMILDMPVATVIVNSAYDHSNVDPGARAQSATTTFASHGPLKGGQEFEGGEGEDIEGGDDWDLFADRLLNGGAFLRGGARGPAHTNPEVIVDAMGRSSGPKYGSKDKEAIQKLHKKLYDQYGQEVVYFYDDKCPSYLHSHNNTFGAPGEKRWVETKNPWAKCQEQMGFQFVSKNGFCYPYGMTCFPEDDLVTTTIKTVDTMDNWIQLTKIYNSVQQKKYNDFIEAEKARIRTEPQNADLTDAEVDELAKSHVPPELEGVPEFGAVQTLVTLSTQLEDAVSEITTTSDANQREEIKRILRSTGSMRDDWADEDKIMEAANLQRIASSLLEDAKKCTDASVAISNNVAADQVTLKLGQIAAPGQAGGVPGLPSTVKQSLITDARDKCDVLKTGDGPADAVLIPKSINQRIDMEKLAKGEPVDPIVNWWRTYYGAKAHEEAKKIAKIASKVSPFEGSIPKASASQKSAEEVLEESLRAALGKRGAAMARNL